jgi:hypothetical protein
MFGKVGVAGLVAALLAAAPAGAATVGVRNTFDTNVPHALPPQPIATVEVAGGPEADVVAVTMSGTTVHVTDAAGLQLGDGCTAAPDGGADCVCRPWRAA